MPIKNVPVYELDDYTGSLQRLKEVIEGLIEEYGPKSVITFDAGYNNISACLIFEEKKYTLGGSWRVGR